MPSYALICKFDDSDNIRQLKKDKKKLCLSTDVEDQQGKAKDSIIGTTKDIQSGTILSWSDTFQVRAKDSDGNWCSKFDITYGQTFTFSTDSKNAADDAKAPPNGFIFRLDADATVSLEQKFGTDGKWGLCHEKAYVKGDNKFCPPLKAGVWFEKASEGTTSTVAWKDKFHIDFSNSFSQTAYFNSNNVWSLTAPDSYSAGALVSMSQGNGGYIVSQVRNNDFELPAAASDDNGSRKSISVSFAGVKVKIYVDIKTLEAGLTASILGISLGSLYGNLKEGIVLHIDLALVSGVIKLYLEGSKPKEVWVAVKVDFVGGAHTAVDEKKKILTL